MGAKTGIEWTDATWNPIRGCSRVSEGCRNCYAETIAGRFSWPGIEHHAGGSDTEEKAPGPYFGLVNARGKWNGEIKFIPSKLDEPLRWRDPKRIFVNSMSDLFHENAEDSDIDQIFAVMLASHLLENRANHTFQILTKRPERMRKYFQAGASQLLQRWAKAGDGFIAMHDEDTLFSEIVYSATVHNWDENGRNSSGSDYKPWGYLDKLFPLPNVLLGVSVEDQKTADERIPILLDIPAWMRFISAEPLLGQILYDPSWLHGCRCRECCEYGVDPFQSDQGIAHAKANKRRKIHQVIVGGESGPGARPMHPDWVRSMRDQCKEAGVAFFFKQWGNFIPRYDRDKADPDFGQTDTVPRDFKPGRWMNLSGGHGFHGDRVHWMQQVGKKKSGRFLDGVEYSEFPI